MNFRQSNLRMKASRRLSSPWSYYLAAEGGGGVLGFRPSNLAAVKPISTRHACFVHFL